MSSELQKEPKVFVIVDGHALIYRAYHAFPALTDPKGRLVNAVYGFTRILLTAIGELKPEYLCVAFDSKGPTKRASELYDQYKAQRAPMPDDLIPQIALVKDVVDALNIPRFELSGFEADDLIGTVSKRVSAGNGVRAADGGPALAAPLLAAGADDLGDAGSDSGEGYLKQARRRGATVITVDAPREVEAAVTALFERHGASNVTSR